MNLFSVITNPVLQANLNSTFEYVTTLSALAEMLAEQKGFASSLRKTIIIHIASIVEALLLWRLRELVQTQKVEMDSEWKYTDIRILYPISESEEIIAGRRKKEVKDIDRIDFLRVIQLCEKHKIITNQKLLDDVNTIREFRNRLHIGGLADIEKEYDKDDLEFCFSVMERVIKLGRK